MISEKSIRNLLSKVAILEQKWIALTYMKAYISIFILLRAESAYLKTKIYMESLSGAT